MSGGHFGHKQYIFEDIAYEIEDVIYGHELDDEYDEQRYIEDRYLDGEEREYIRKHHHTIPNWGGYSKETLREFRKAIKLLRQAHIYVQRIDWLLSGDDSEDTFHERLKEELDKLKRTRNKNERL